MGTNALQFNLEIDVAVSKLEDQFVVFYKGVTLELLKKIVLKNPVLTGYSQNNWQVGVGNSREDEVTRIGLDTSETLVDAEAALRALNNSPFAIVYIYNNVPYITVLEGGGSQQAPNGFVQLSIDEMRGLIKSAGRKL